MTVHVKMLLKDGVSFRLLTAVDPVNIQVIASDPDLGGVPVLTVSNPPSKHIIANDAWIMNEKGDTISKIDYKALTKVGTPEPIKPITYAEKTVDVIAGTPIFKPEKMEEQHRGAEFGAFIGLDFYPFYCIAPSLVREYGVYASDEIIEQLRKTKLVSYVFLTLLKENAEKYNPESKTITVTEVGKPWFLNSKEALGAIEEVLSPESLEACEKQLTDDPDVTFVIVHTPEIVSNLLSSVLVVAADNDKYSCTAYYPGKTMTPKDFLPADLKAYIGMGDYSVFGVYRDKGAVILTKLSLDNTAQSDYYQTALARKRFYEAHPQFMETLSAAQTSVSGIVDALKGPSLSVSTGVQLAGVEEIEKPHYKIDIPSEITATLSKSSLVILTNAIGDTIYKPFEGNILVKVTPDVNGYLVQVTLDTAHRVVELPPTHVAILGGELMPAASKTYFKVYALDGGKIVFDEVDADSKAVLTATPNTDQMKQVLLDKLDNIPVGIANNLTEEGLDKFKAFVIDHVKGLLRADVRVTTTCGAGSYTDTVKISTAQHMMEFPAMVTPLGKTDVYPPKTQTVWNVHQSEGEFVFALVEEN